jgi:KipI family sensor histidine kinase inhibitor
MGEAALLVEAHEPDIALANGQAITLAKAIESASLAGSLAGIRLAQPAINSVLIRFDPLATTFDEVHERIAAIASRLARAVERASSVITIPVSYDDADGPDLEEAARALGLTTDEVITEHTHRSYRVLMIGFAPGFPYIGPLPHALTLPRRSTPRVAVPAGSVAIAAGMTGIYPSRLPGGWHLIGHTDVTLFDPQREHPSLLQAGDWVKFTAS